MDRNTVEIELLKYEHVRPYTPDQSKVIEKYKDGSFGVSNLAFALYSNGNSLRGKSQEHPFGLLYEDGETLFSIGYYRKVLDTNDSPGYLMIVAPRGKEAVRKAIDFSNKVLGNERIQSKGVYMRFLTLNQYLETLNSGFLPVKESPWHPEAPEEDETYNNSIISIDDLLTTNSVGIISVNLIRCKNRNSRRKARDGYKRFKNFLERNNLKYSLIALTKEKIRDAKEVIDFHFEILRGKGKTIGSTPEDHYNSLDPEILAMSGISAYIGYLGKQPVSIFVGESLSSNKFALYTPFTIRDATLLNFELLDEKGFSAMPLYSYLQLFAKLREEGIREVHLGGSEFPDLNLFKRQLGGKSEISYWAIKLK